MTRKVKEQVEQVTIGTETEIPFPGFAMLLNGRQVLDCYGPGFAIVALNLGRGGLEEVFMWEQKPGRAIAMRLEDYDKRGA